MIGLGQNFMIRHRFSNDYIWSYLRSLHVGQGQITSLCLKKVIRKEKLKQPSFISVKLYWIIYIMMSLSFPTTVLA